MRQRTRQCSAGDAPIELRSKYCTGPEVEEEQCSGEPCKPYWSYSPWRQCNCGSINTTREKHCTKLLNKHSEHQVLPDSECAGLQHEPLERKCSGPENPETCKANESNKFDFITTFIFNSIFKLTIKRHSLLAVSRVVVQTKTLCSLQMNSKKTKTLKFQTRSSYLVIIWL